MTRSRTRRTAVLAAAVSMLVAGCSASGADDGRTTISVATYGDFGYEELFAEYEAQHPEIDLVSRVSDFETHHRTLATQLAGGRGAADVVAIEEQYLPRFRQTKDEFVNLADFGAQDLRGQWTRWKWEQGLSKDGRFVLGLGTDMGSLAMCYRKDRFAEAGLPTDRDEVAALWPTWEKFAGVADRFTASGTDTKFVDSAGSIYTALLNQAEENFFAKADDSLIAGTNPHLRRAFDLAGQLGVKHQTSEVTAFTQDWNVAIKQGSFAVTTCPAWMLEQIEDAGGPENAGKWDVTAVPDGGGNWGGSFLTVPAQSEHPKEAYEVARWLTAPEQQKKLFVREGILPSEPSVYQDPEVMGVTDPYFSDAPIGRIYAGSANNVRPNYRGPKDAEARPPFGHALERIEAGKQTVEQAWNQAVHEAREAVR